MLVLYLTLTYGVYHAALTLSSVNLTLWLMINSYNKFAWGFAVGMLFTLTNLYLLDPWAAWLFVARFEHFYDDLILLWIPICILVAVTLTIRRLWLDRKRVKVYKSEDDGPDSTRE